MQKKLIQAGLLGINKDVINQKVSQQQAYEIKNFRLNSTLDSNSFELTTERGTKPLQLSHDNTQVKGTIIGYCVLNQYLVLFTHENTTDRIYRIEIKNEVITDITLMFEGNLDFQKNVNDPTKEGLIDAIPYYENDKVQKVYWIDGINQPRVINIVSNGDIHVQGTSTQADYDPYGFVQEIYGDYNRISITRSYVGGMFNAGVIQYAYSFFNENAQETPVIDVTPLYYIAHEDRGEKPDIRIGCTFKLSLDVPQDFHDKFDYVRFYSIYRSALDTTPLVKVINEIKTSDLTGNNNLFSITFTDDNTQGYVYDGQKLLIQNYKIIPQTFNYKDGKLFFGNYKNDMLESWPENDSFEGQIDIDWTTKDLEIQDENDRSVYNYENQLNKNSEEIKTFKSGEYYKFGIQLQDKYGNWSKPYLVGTLPNTKTPVGYNNNANVDYCYDGYKVAIVKSQDNVSKIISDTDLDVSNFIRIRPVVTFAKPSERTILCQGIANPTVFNLGQRCNGTCFAQSSWFFRPFPTDTAGENDPAGTLSYKKGLSYVQWKHNAPLFNSDKLNGELQNMYSDYVKNINVLIPTEDTTNTHWYRNYHSADADFNILLSFYDGLTEYQISHKLLMLQQGQSPLEHRGMTFNCLYNLGDDFHNPIYQGNDNGQTYIQYARVTETLIYPTGSTQAGGYKFTVYTVKYYTDSETFGDNIDEYTDYYSINGTNWQYGVGHRDRMLAHEITENQKDIYESYYYNDNQICTLNSPEVEFDSNTINTDLTNYKLTIKGISTFANQVGKYNIIAEAPLFLNDVDSDPGDATHFIRGTKMAKGFHDKKFETIVNDTNFWKANGGMVVSALNCWWDDICNIFTKDGHSLDWNRMKFQNSFVVYPWQRQHLNNYNGNQFLCEVPSSNDKRLSTTNETESSKIVRKVLSNLRFGYTKYTQSPNYLPINTNYIKLFNFDEPQYKKLEDDKFYSGNIDQLIVCNSQYNDYIFEWGTYNSDGTFNPIWRQDKAQGYPIVVGQYTDYGNFDDMIGWQDMYHPYGQKGNDHEKIEQMASPNNRSTDSIWIRYKSSPHIVFGIAKNSSLQNETLPVLQSDNHYDNSHCLVHSYNGSTVWDNDYKLRGTPIIAGNYISSSNYQSYLWVLDVYNDQLNNNYINSTSKDFDLLNRIWLPCGKSLELKVGSQEYIEWTEGDTFFQRYDCLKTYPFSNDDYQSVVEIGSFMLETRINLDGRYDTNRGLMDNTAVTKENFNLINPVYSQMNNFFQYRVLDDRFNNDVNEYKNRITWTLNKQNGDDVDEWTRITELGIMDMDGDKGQVTKIERFDNDLYVFQDSGVAKLAYNEKTLIPTEGNTPIEVAQSNYVDGKRYISEKYGLQDKWCSVSTPKGVFFKDGYLKALFSLKYDDRGQSTISPLSYNTIQKWTEKYIDNIYRVNYDGNVDEVLFMIDDKADEDYKDSALAYSLQFGQFTSFYDYKGFIGNYKNISFSIDPTDSSNIWLMRLLKSKNVPSFNQFYGSIKPYWIKWTSIVDEYDCIFNNIYLKGNTYINEDETNSMNDNDVSVNAKGYTKYQPEVTPQLPFDNISVSTDKQAYEMDSVQPDVWKEFKPIKKFGVWRGEIPRLYAVNGQYLGSRIRNHWVRIGLKNEYPSEYKTIVRDIKVDAFY